LTKRINGRHVCNSQSEPTGVVCPDPQRSGCFSAARQQICARTRHWRDLKGRPQPGGPGRQACRNAYPWGAGISQPTYWYVPVQARQTSGPHKKTARGSVFLRGLSKIMTDAERATRRARSPRPRLLCSAISPPALPADRSVVVFNPPAFVAGAARDFR
jgi:hypothetical protein